jgi:hypothetical protein
LTYNFDPDRWLDNERAFLDRRLRRGELSESEHEREMDRLERRWRRMWDRLDGTYDVIDRPAETPEKKQGKQ